MGHCINTSSGKYHMNEACDNTIAFGSVGSKLSSKHAHVFIDISSRVSKEEATRLLSRKNIQKNSLDNSFQGLYIPSGSRLQPLKTENYF